MNTGSFPPPKQRGLLIHGILLFVLSVVVVMGFIQLSSADVGPAFLIWLLVALAAFVPIPFFAYRIFAL